jgi:hypothetical protein
MKIEISYFLTSEENKLIEDKNGKILGKVVWLEEGISPDNLINISEIEERKIYSADEGKVLHNKKDDEIYDGKLWILDSELDDWEEVEKPEVKPEFIVDENTGEIIPVENIGE